MLFRFNIEEVKKIYDHATKNPKKTMEPSFIFVVDHGCYLTSNGQRGGESAADLDLVIYAEDWNPSLNENWWDLRIALKKDTGKGDDFAEMISCKWLDMVLELDDKREFLVLEITADQVILILEEEEL